MRVGLELLNNFRVSPWTVEGVGVQSGTHVGGGKARAQEFGERMEGRKSSEQNYTGGSALTKKGRGIDDVGSQK